MNYEIGNKYLVDIAICKDKLSGKRVTIPILPLRHKDSAFGVERFHYHVDCRFQMSESVINGFDIKNNTTVIALWDDENQPPNVQYIVVKTGKAIRKCVSTHTGFDLDWMKMPPGNAQQKNVNKYLDWYKSMIGKSCAGKKCPHYGTEMIDNGKHLTCPMHNLMGDRITEKIISLTNL